IVAGNAAATNGEPVTLGQWKTATFGTRADLDGSTGPGLQAFLFQSGTSRDGSGLGAAAALAGVSSYSGTPCGVLGYTYSQYGSGVHGQNDNPLGERAGVTGVGNSANGAGMYAQNYSGIALKAEGVIGLNAIADDYGVKTTGSAAALWLHGNGLPPQSRGGVHNAGEIDIDENNDVWCCVATGSPGVWRKVAGGATAGQFHPITPARVYDSRKPAPASPLATGANRLVTIANKIDANGAIAFANIVPSFATAIAYNLTVVNTVGTNGYLAVNPGGITAVSASAINWNASGQTLANASVVQINSSRQVTVVCGGTSTSTNFIIDVVGYYR
ncbi:MAG: hypothetical protein ABMA25_22765, partial [Ilumatobacteraceae bacterium]